MAVDDPPIGAPGVRRRLPAEVPVEARWSTRWTRRLLVAACAAALAACSGGDSSGPGDPEAGAATTAPTTATAADDDGPTSSASTGSTEPGQPPGSTHPAGSRDAPESSGSPTSPGSTGPDPGAGTRGSAPATDPAGDGGSGSTRAPAPAEPSTTSTAPPTRPSGLAARFGTILVDLVTASGELLRLCLLDADTAGERNQGLREVTDLEGHDGMLFRWDEPSRSSFVMADTVTPLTISWWEGDGSFVSSTDMAPCTEADSGDCRRYAADGPYRYAVEVFRGDLAAARPGARLEPRIGSACRAS